MMEFSLAFWTILVLFLCWSRRVFCLVEIDAAGSKVMGQSRMWSRSPYWAFLGIRYGKPPIGSMRFKESSLEPLPSFTNATEFGPRCHPIGFDEKADEDCLFVNVFCPPINRSTEHRAVLMFLHGGGNILGNSEFVDGGALTTENNIIVVSFNYRLGPLGFLSANSNHSDGNYGLLDQRLALIWIKRYIQYFGGDANRITLMGVSAGGKDISVHTVSRGSKDLFHRAIMLSGTLFGPSLYSWDPVVAARRLAERVNCTRTSVLELKSCLRQIPAQVLTRHATNLWPDYPMRTVLDFGWGAVRDNETVAGEIRSGTFKGEVLLGINNNEGSLFYENKLPFVKANDPLFTRTILTENSFKNHFIKESLYQYYLKQPTERAIEDVYKTYAGSSGSVTLRQAMDFYADQQYVAPAMNYLKSNISQGDAYLYYFAHNLDKNERGDKLLRGSHHTDDEAFALGLVSDPTEYTDAERNLSRLMRIYISNFVISGNPNKPVKLDVEFHKYYDEDYPFSFLHVTGNSEVITDIHSAVEAVSSLLPWRMPLWMDRLPLLMEGSTLNSSSSS